MEKTKKRSRKRGAGGKLSRSEIIQTRLNPKLRFTAELMARHAGRSLSNFIEQLIVEKAVEYQLPGFISEEARFAYYLTNDRDESMPAFTHKLIDYIWSPDPPERFVLTGLYAPDLLTIDEERVWVWLRDKSYFWDCFIVDVVDSSGKTILEEPWHMVDRESLRRDRLNVYWPYLEAVKDGKASILSLNELKIPPIYKEQLLREREIEYYPHRIQKYIKAIKRLVYKERV